jgi:hypothetical protein
MDMYSFLSPFHEVKFYGVPSCVFDKLGCAMGEESLRNTGLDYSTYRDLMLVTSSAHLKNYLK